MKKLTKARVKKLIELHEYYSNGLRLLSGVSVCATNLRRENDIWVADVTFSEWDEDGGEADVYAGWKYSEKELRSIEAKLMKEKLLN